MNIASIFRGLRRDRPWLGVTLGAALFAMAVILRWFLGGLSEGFGPMTFLPAIMLAGLFGGIQVAVGVAVLSLLVAWVLFFPPYGTFTLASYDLITIGIFIVTAALEIYVIRALNLTIDALSAEQERSNTLFRELQHRVANNLHFVAALLQLRKKTLDRDSAGAHALEAARGRLDLLASVHRRLNDPNIVNLPVGGYLADLCGDLIKASDRPDIRLAVEAKGIELDLDSLMSVSLIAAELVTNSLKHAFHGRAEGAIAVSFEKGERSYNLTVADDGCGLPAEIRAPKVGSLGKGILESLASQMGGSIAFERGQGTRARLVFPA
jgi:two-component sensor histidine kinase